MNIIAEFPKIHEYESTEMSVVYMRKLEEKPETYDNKFTTLTKGVNLEVNSWILNKLGSSETVLEVGCGTGILASRIASKGHNVVAIDKDYKMISHAMKNYPTGEDLNLLYQIGTFSDFPIEPNSKDAIISTFMLSELRPLEQQIFLRKVWTALKPDGRLLLSAEFLPSGIWKVPFKIRRWRYKKKLKRQKLNQTQILKHFFQYIELIGYTITSQKQWKHGAIQALELKKSDQMRSQEPRYYFPEQVSHKGFKSHLKILRCLLTGQVDSVPIEPGIYQSGNPNKDSPILVTANYEYSYIKLLKHLKGIDAWILCVDSNGINVWCAARGNDFGNRQLLEAVEATGIQAITEGRTLILPQLAAGGVSIPNLPKNSDKFKFQVKYGPVWSSTLPEYLKFDMKEKNEKMRILKFNLSHRMRAWITHTTFLFRKIFLVPILAFFFIFLILAFPFGQIWTHKSLIFLEIVLWILITNVLISMLFPLSSFSRKFIYKSLFFGILNLIALGSISYLIHGQNPFILWMIIFQFWLGFFSTMSFSGYTMTTNPKEIQAEYPLFTKINKVILISSLIFLTIGICFY
ncbi:MAG: methyltransferase domain-containing protein [Candidatus Lokiarchaeota archaeon]|nr:methyltransferase domain-containing protein [Candidatus Lokiarchaeota archaeon]